MNQKDTLRTLKDFIDDIKTHNVSDEWKRQRYLTLKMLRQEVIKWIKEFNEKEAIVKFLKHFFNITDRDLKNDNL